MSEEFEATKVIAEFENEPDAIAAQAALRTAGIEALLTNDNAVFFSLLGRLQFNPIRLAVPTSRAEAALLVLAQLDESPEAGWEEHAEGAIDGWLCFNCDTVMSEDELACTDCGTLRSEQPPEDDDDE